MKWALQTTLINQEQAVEVMNAVARTRMPFVFADMLPMSDHLPDAEQFVVNPEGVDYIPYGSTTLMKTAMKRGWKGLAFNPETFRHTVWQYHRRVLNSEAICMTIVEAADEASRWGQSEKLWFIRPNDDLKLFNGTVDQVGNIPVWLRKGIETGAFKADDKVVWCQTWKNRIAAEWRCFVIEGNVVDSSMYRCEGRLQKRHVDDPALKYQFQKLAQDEWLPHKNCVMDVVLDGYGQFKVLEFNCINSTGFYDNDIELVVRTLGRSYGL